jgi:predicted XRE-type DNA-binding protein
MKATPSDPPGAPRQKPIRWVGSAKKDLQRMPDDVQDVFGFALHELQHGDAPDGARRFGEGLNSKIWKLATDAEELWSQAVSRTIGPRKSAKTAKSSRTAKPATKTGSRAKAAAAPVASDGIEDGTGNVFADLGLPDAELRLAKAHRARAIKHTIVAREWTQAQAARTAGMAASDMSDICRGKLAKFSAERLDETLLALGVDIEVRLRPRSAAGHRGTLRVLGCTD